MRGVKRRSLPARLWDPSVPPLGRPRLRWEVVAATSASGGHTARLQDALGGRGDAAPDARDPRSSEAPPGGARDLGHMKMGRCNTFIISPAGAPGTRGKGWIHGVGGSTGLGVQRTLPGRLRPLPSAQWVATSPGSRDQAACCLRN